MTPSLCFLDIETTGLDATVDSVLEVGLVFVEHGAISARRHWQVKAPGAVSPFITALTGLDGAEGSAASLGDISQAFRDAIAGWTVVAHNARFEQAFLGELLDGVPMIDSWELAQLCFPELPGHSLDALIKWAGVGRAARHRALDDAEDAFRVTAAVLERLTRAGRDHSFAADLEHHSPLRRLLEALPRSEVAHPTLEPVAPPPDAEWAQDLSGLVRSAPGTVLLEVERADTLDAVWALAAAAGPSAVAVPSRLFKAQAQRRPSLATRPACREGLKRELERLPIGFARAWLRAWLVVGRTLDVETVPRSILERAPSVVEALEAATTCTCRRDDCPTRRPCEPTVLISHEAACRFLEQGDGRSLFIVEADQLPAAERKRLEQVLSLEELEAFSLETSALRELMARLPGRVLVGMRTHHDWVRLRELLQAHSHALQQREVSHRRARLLTAISSVLEPPGPGFETLIFPATIARVPVRPAEGLARRLRRGHTLVSSFVGGLRWTRRAAWAIPARSIGTRVEWVDAPTPLDELAALLTSVKAQVLVSAEPLEALTEALASRGLAVSLDGHQDRSLHLTRWKRDELISTDGTCVFYGVKELRRAALSSAANRTVLLSPHGIAEAVALESLRGLEARRFER